MAATNPPSQNPPKGPGQQQAAQARPKESMLEELHYLQQLYQNQYLALANDINDRMEALKSFNSTQQTLENMDTIVNKNLLLGLGGGAYASGKMSDPKRIIVGVGAGFLVEKEIDGAKGYVAKAIERATQNINKLTKERRDLENAIMEVSYKVEELSH